MLTGITGAGLRDKQRLTRRAGPAFSVPGAEPGRAAAIPVAAAPDMAGLLPLLALQEEDEAARDRRARDRARAMLDELAALQSGLLAGYADAASLARLTVLASAPNEAADPRLAEIADWVALRANVMLARLARV